MGESMKLKFKYQPRDEFKGSTTVTAGSTKTIVDLTGAYFKGLVAIFTKVEVQNIGTATGTVTVNAFSQNLDVGVKDDFAPIVVKYGEKLDISASGSDFRVNYVYVLLPAKAVLVEAET